jgi:hypothetical protein
MCESHVVTQTIADVIDAWAPRLSRDIGDAHKDEAMIDASDAAAAHVCVCLCVCVCVCVCMFVFHAVIR